MSAASAATTRSHLGVAQHRGAFLVTVGAVLTAATVVAAVTSPVLRDPGVAAGFRGLFVAAWVCVGIHLWRRRPESRLGLLLVAVGLVYAATSLMAFADPWAFTVGRVILAAFLILLIYVFVCYPRDRLGTSPERALVAVVAAGSVARGRRSSVSRSGCPPDAPSPNAAASARRTRFAS